MEFPYACAPLQVAGLTLKNRMFSAPASLPELGPQETYSQDNINHYKMLAVGGAAMVTVGDVIVELDSGRSHPQQVGINEDCARPSLAAVADAIHSGGAHASIELNHGGALCSPAFLKGGRNAIGPSGYVDAWGDTVEEMTRDDMERIADAFADGARVARSCGFDLVMLHMGHGWLLHQFLSPLTNFRTDEFGGSLENRLRYPLLVLERIRSAVGSFPIEVRISGDERAPGGYGIETGIQIAQALDGKADLIHVSAGTQQDDYSAVLMHPGIFQKHGENSHLAAAIKPHVHTPVVTVGAFSQPEKVEEFLAAGHADAVAMGRALVADPFFPRKLIRGQPEQITPCIRCGECHGHMMSNRVVRCTVNPLVGREQDFFHPIPVGRKRSVLVAGGGPGGMQAALSAWERGHSVTLCERSDHLGGALDYADAADFKESLKLYRDSQIRKVLASGIQVRLQKQVDEALVRELKPDVLIAAVGAEPIPLPVPVEEGAHVVMGASLGADSQVGDRVVVIGGGLIGCEEGVHLARQGHQVTILELQDALAADCGRLHRINLHHQMDMQENLTGMPGWSCTRVTAQGVCARNGAGEETFLPADTVVCAVGMRARHQEVEQLRPLVREFYVVGDAWKARKILNAVRDGYDAAVNLGL